MEPSSPKKELPLSKKSSLNNKIILLRKVLKEAIRKEYLSLKRKVTKLKLKEEQHRDQILRRESEIQCFKMIKAVNIPLHLSVFPDRLKKSLCSQASTELDRIYAKILLNPLIQGKVVPLTEEHGEETVENVLKINEKNIRNNIVQKLSHNKKKTSKTSKKKSKTDSSSEEEETSNNDSFFIKSDSVKAEESVKKKQPREKLCRKREEKSSLKVKTFKHISPKLPPPPPPPQVPAPKPDNDVHPSWKAKAELRKSQAVTFTGMKIKFSD